ncbi:MAG: Ig-like domain-containing protein [Candidatus Acidiferrum sp.]
MKANRKIIANKPLASQWMWLSTALLALLNFGCAGLVSQNTPKQPAVPPPAVSITAPAAGVTVNGTISVTATASSSVGITGVQFQLDGASFGSVMNASPFIQSLITTTLTNGKHTLTAVATDTDNNKATSAGVSITVNNAVTPPTVSITAPANGATESGTIAVTASATSAAGIASVQFQVDGANSGAAVTTAPYSLSLNTTTLTNAKHMLTAVATDKDNDKTTSAGVSITVSNTTTTPPTVSITAPANGATESGTIAVTASATSSVGIASVQFQVDGANSGAADTTAPYSLSLNTATLTNAKHTLTAVATDTANNKTTSVGVPITVSNTTTAPPAVSITAPTNGATESGTIAMTASATSSVGIASVQFQVDGANSGAAVTTAPYSISLNTTTLTNAKHTLTAVATDTANNKTTSAGVSITVSNSTTTPPTVSITAPTNGATVSATVTVTASASSTVGIASVQFLLDGANLGAAVTTSPYQTSWDTTQATNGTHTLAAQAKDTLGTTTTSGGVSVDVSNAATQPPPAASDTIKIYETTGTAQTNRAISVSRAFVQGEILNYAQASVGGAALLTQCDVKNRWPDGSLKFAIVSFIISSLPANGSVTVSFSNQTTGNNTGFLAQSDMLSTPYNFEAQIKETGTASHTISARTMLTNGNFRYWLQGPIVTAVILEDRSTARAYDFNADGAAGNPLHPLFEAWFYPQGNRVEVGYTVEDVWAGSVAANSMRDQTYSFVLTSGLTSPVTEFTQPSFNHIGRSRWYRHFWLGNNAPPTTRIDHNVAYIVQTKVIPNYMTTLTLSPSMVSGEEAGWTSGDQTLVGNANGVGEIPNNMDAGGAAETIGLMATWETMYLLNMNVDDQLLNKVLGNADLVGRVPMHYREADTDLFFDTANSVNAFGHVTSINARPMENLGIGPGNDFNDNCSGANTLTLNLGTVSTDNWDVNGMDPSHWPEFGFVAYLVTGKYYYMEETQFAGGYMTAWGHGCPGTARDGAAGVLNQSQYGRGVAWSFRTVTHGWLASPDGTPEQAYFNDKLQNSIAGFEGEKAIPLSDSTRQAVWTWAQQNFSDPNGVSPLHFYAAGESDFIEFPVRTDGFVLDAWSPWEESYLLNTYGMARDAGLANIGDIMSWDANRWFHLALDTINVNNIYLIGTYRFPTKLSSTNNWITNYADYKSGYLGNGSGLPTSWTFFWPCDYQPDDDKRYEGLATLAVLYPYTADGFTGQNAWTTVNQSMWNTSGCLPADFESSSLASPKWAIVPRTN